MNLQEFVSQTLVQIASGVRDADAELLAIGAIINPRHVAPVSGDKGDLYGFIAEEKNFRRAVHAVEFDVAVTAVEGKEAKGGIRIAIGFIGMGGEGRSEESNSSVSRVKFKVPIALPNSKTVT